MRTFVNGSRFNSRAGRVTPVLGVRLASSGGQGRTSGS